MEPRHIGIEYPEREMTRERISFLEERRLGIGGSDVAAILGISPWKSPLEVYLDKTGGSDVDRDNEFMFWGSSLEDVVAREAAHRLGVTVQRVNQTVVHPLAHWRRANLDRRIVDPGAELMLMDWVPEHLKTLDRRVRLGLEVKTANAWVASEWMDEGVPLPYQAQVQWYLHVTGWDAWVLSTLFGGQKLESWVLEPDKVAIDEIVQKVDAFWHDHVLAGVPPEPGPGDPDAVLLRKLYPKEDSGKEVLYEDHAADVDHWRKVYLRSHDEIKSLEGDKQEAANHIKHIMADGEVMYLPDGRRMMWKTSKPSVKMDVELLKEEHLSIYEMYTKEVPGPRVLRVPKIPKKHQKKG